MQKIKKIIAESVQRHFENALAVAIAFTFAGGLCCLISFLLEAIFPAGEAEAIVFSKFTNLGLLLIIAGVCLVSIFSLLFYIFCKKTAVGEKKENVMKKLIAKFVGKHPAAAGAISEGLIMVCMLCLILAISLSKTVLSLSFLVAAVISFYFSFNLCFTRPKKN